MPGSKPENILVRLERYKLVNPVTGCWQWNGSHNSEGYGQIRYKNKQLAVHRLSAHLYLGLDLNSELNALHKIECTNKDCFNFEHLYIGTRSDNMLDIVRSGKHNNASKTHCPKGHILDGCYYDYGKVHGYNGNKVRYCKTCRMIRYWAKVKAKNA